MTSGIVLKPVLAPQISLGGAFGALCCAMRISHKSTELSAIGGTMADTSLWPVVVGGLLTGLFALGGLGVGLVGTARRDV